MTKPQEFTATDAWDEKDYEKLEDSARSAPSCPTTVVELIRTDFDYRNPIRDSIKRTNGMLPTAIGGVMGVTLNGTIMALGFYDAPATIKLITSGISWVGGMGTGYFLGLLIADIAQTPNTTPDSPCLEQTLSLCQRECSPDDVVLLRENRGYSIGLIDHIDDGVTIHHYEGRRKVNSNSIVSVLATGHEVSLADVHYRSNGTPLVFKDGTSTLFGYARSSHFSVNPHIEIVAGDFKAREKGPHTPLNPNMKAYTLSPKLR